MPIPSESGHSFRVRVPVILERGRDNPVRIEDRLGNAIVEPDSATLSLISPAGVVLSEPSVTINGDGVPTATIPSSDLGTSVGYGQGYGLVWTLTTDGVDTTVRQPAIVARNALHCPVTCEDLADLIPDLETTLRTGAGSAQSFIDTAWADAIQRLNSAGRWAECIVNVDALHRPVREGALALLWAWRAGLQYPGAADREAAHRRNAEAAWGQARLWLDEDQDGNPDSDTAYAAQPSIPARSAPAHRYLHGFGRGAYRRFGG